MKGGCLILLDRSTEEVEVEEIEELEYINYLADECSNDKAIKEISRILKSGGEIEGKIARKISNIIIENKENRLSPVESIESLAFILCLVLNELDQSNADIIPG